MAFSEDGGVKEGAGGPASDVVRITAHGEFRLLKRLKLPLRSLERMARNAYLRGKRPEDFEGGFRKYLEYLQRKKGTHGHKVDVAVYGDNIFIFAGKNLITAWPKRWAHD